MKIGMLIRQLRESRSLTQESLAVKTGLKPSAISAIENEKTNPTVATLTRLAKGIGCHPAEFFGISPGDDGGEKPAPRPLPDERKNFLETISARLREAREKAIDNPDNRDADSLKAVRSMLQYCKDWHYPISETELSEALKGETPLDSFVLAALCYMFKARADWVLFGRDYMRESADAMIAFIDDLYEKSQGEQEQRASELQELFLEADKETQDIAIALLKKAVRRSK